MENRIKHHLCEAYGISEDDVSGLFVIGKKTVNETLNRLNKAICDSNLAETVDAAHMLKGTLYNMGLAELGDLAKSIELDAKQGQTDQADQRRMNICSALGNVLEEKPNT